LNQKAEQQEFNLASLDIEHQYTIHMYKEVAKLQKGKSFGELALLTFKSRAATITCLEPTDLAVMDK
jgi:hypothetical protein